MEIYNGIFRYESMVSGWKKNLSEIDGELFPLNSYNLFPPLADILHNESFPYMYISCSYLPYKMSADAYPITPHIPTTLFPSIWGDSNQPNGKRSSQIASLYSEKKVP